MLLSTLYSDRLNPNIANTASAASKSIWVEAANSIANYLRTEIDTYRIGGDGDNDDCELVDVIGQNLATRSIPN